MKSIIKSIFYLSLIYCVTGCVAVVPLKSAPGNSSQAPGQIKKATGSQSAKPYAPGQKKKN